eukprot:TRINITY_DN6630_c0_g1_i1.p1 TRINITY_DN6630_c0_g1~~TRINITY_DN6630_c0_g1_i1.p1  ORF type:complete len:536 (+),score=107.74 TRINITY_DN6630_c0_g1_i1:6-1613(+)
MSTNTRLVPWCNWEEWEQVYQWLYSQDIQLVKTGIDRVRVWQSRGKVPLAILATSDLLEIYNNDVSIDTINIKASRSSNELKLMYSMAISRMVNGLVNPFHGTYAASIGSVAYKIGLPTEIVDLRHEASHHSYLPSLPILRNATLLALNWLEENYWKQQEVKKVSTKDSIKQLLVEYRKLQGNITTKKKNNDTNKSDYRNNRKKLFESIESICTASNVNTVLIPLLLENNFLIPKKRNNLKPFKKLPLRLRKMWAIALKRFSKRWDHFLYTLLLSIVQAITEAKNRVFNYENERQYYCSLLVCWYVYLIEYYSRTIDEGDTSSYISFHSIMRMCSKKMDKWTIKIMRSTVNLIPGDILKENISKVIDLYESGEEIRRFERGKSKKRTIQQALETDQDMNITLDQAEQLIEQKINEKRLKRMKISYPLESSHWKISAPLDLGMGLLNGNLPNLELPPGVDDLQMVRFKVPTVKQISEDVNEDEILLDANLMDVEIASDEDDIMIESESSEEDVTLHPKFSALDIKQISQNIKILGA